MINKEQIDKEFDEKIKTYDKDGGFIVYVEGYDNKDFDCDLIKDFYNTKLLQAQEEAVKEERERVKEIKDLEKDIEYEQMQYDIGVKHPTDTEGYRKGQRKHYEKIQNLKSSLQALKDKDIKI